MRLYLETSALVKLLVAEPGSVDAQSLHDDASEVLTARVTYVEARAAVAAARRIRRLRPRAFARAREQLELRWRLFAVVELDAELARSAGEAAERHRLRGLDAVHLASALVLRDPEVVVASWDADVRRATAEAGLFVAP